MLCSQKVSKKCFCWWDRYGLENRLHCCVVRKVEEDDDDDNNDDDDDNNNNNNNNIEKDRPI